MSYLGVDFYRNYIGIENPLRVELPHEDGGYMISEFDYCSSSYLYETGSSDEFDFSECRPHLKLPEDLTYSEIHYIFDTQATTHKIHRYNDSVCVSVKIGCCGEEYDLVYNDDDQKLTQDQFNRLYACHSALNAEELIRKNLAIKIEVKNER